MTIDAALAVDPIGVVGETGMKVNTGKGKDTGKRYGATEHDGLFILSHRRGSNCQCSDQATKPGKPATFFEDVSEHVSSPCCVLLLVVHGLCVPGPLKHG